MSAKDKSNYRLHLHVLAWLKARKDRAPAGLESKSSGGGSVEVEKADWSSHPLFKTPTKRATPPASKWWPRGTTVWWGATRPLRSEDKHPTNAEQSTGEQGQMTNPPQISPPPKTTAPPLRGDPLVADERLKGDGPRGGRLNTVERALKILMLALACIFLLIASLCLAMIMLFGSYRMHVLGLSGLVKAGEFTTGISNLFGKPSPASGELEVVPEWAKQEAPADHPSASKNRP